MMSHKHVNEFGFKDYQLPLNARGPRSVRKRRIFEKKLNKDDKICPMDLLATVAGNLLPETESSLKAIDKSVNLIEDNCVVTQDSTKEEVLVEEKPVKPVYLYEENPYQGSLSPCGFSSMINGKVEGEAGAAGFSNSSGTDSCKVGNFSQDLKPHIDDGAVVVDARPNVIVSLGSNSSSSKTEVLGTDASPGIRHDVNLFSRDDDENISGYISPRVSKKSPRTVPRIGDRRIKKILASRHWKGGSRQDSKPWRNSYLLHQRSYPIKKRRYFDYISDSESYRLGRSKMQRASRAGSSMKGQGASFMSSDSRVRVRIKSFRVPELFIEIPETASVGSLKRMVMEAVSSLLSDGHRVGLMVQGKKVRDDSKTLHQTGISKDNIHLDGISLDFGLEPSSETSRHLCEELPICLDNMLESEHSAATVTDDSKALVPYALTELSLQPSCQKAKRSEQQQQRRIRRPFSVTEVEALVQAVEKLGTGRWRDVKYCAFQDADHRTYVDLKDKWKTLVHTAKISPQQRRGEPVPQELLNRVLKAHGYWSQQNMLQKQKQKHQETLPQTEALLLLT